jgi:hypothetical protein
MTPWIAQSLAGLHLAELRAGQGGRAPETPKSLAPVGHQGAPRPARWRKRLGRLLLEAGLHLLATTPT